MPADERPGVHLQHAPSLELVTQGGRPRSARPLRMRDDYREAAVAKLIGGCGEVIVQRPERRLDEQPPATGRPVGDAVELRLTQPPDHFVAELGAAANR